MPVRIDDGNAVFRPHPYMVGGIFGDSSDHSVRHLSGQPVATTPCLQVNLNGTLAVAAYPEPPRMVKEDGHNDVVTLQAVLIAGRIQTCNTRHIGVIGKY